MQAKALSGTRVRVDANICPRVALSALVSDVYAVHTRYMTSKNAQAAVFCTGVLAPHRQESRSRLSKPRPLTDRTSDSFSAATLGRYCPVAAKMGESGWK